MIEKRISKAIFCGRENVLIKKEITQQKILPLMKKKKRRIGK